MYPTRFQLSELSAHVVGVLERRRGAFATFDEKTEAALLSEAKTALSDAARHFQEVADDPAYWKRVEHTLLTVVVPRYLRLAKEQDALERRKYDLWRGGDVIARAAYAALGLVLAAIIWRTALPKWIEPLPVTLFLFGPLLPDVQAWFAKRRYAKQLATLVEEMRHEQLDAREYQPLLDSPVSEVEQPAVVTQQAEKQGEK